MLPAPNISTVEGEHLDRFLRCAATGMLGGVLAFAALNSLSYFVRTGGNLERHGGRIGFPWLVWEDNGRLDGQFYPDALLANIAVGLSASVVIGCLIALVLRGERRIWRPRFDAPARAQESANKASHGESRWPRQFSLRGLLLLTTSVAALLALGQEVDASVKRQLLIPLYLFGPGLLVLTYYLTARLARRVRERIVLIVPMHVILATFILGASAGLNDLTLVALGFYVYWTPQCVLLLSSIFIWRLVKSP